MLRWLGVYGVEVETAVRNRETGAIITLMPTSPTSFRLSPRTRRTLSRLAKQRGKSMSEILELAVSHLDGTLRNRQPIYLDEPDDDQPKAHKAASVGR